MSKLKSIEMRGADYMKTKSRTAKRILCVILAIVLLVSSEGLLPQIYSSGLEMVHAQAATVKLNRTSCVLDIGKTMYLKMIGTKSKPKWYTSNKSVVTVGNTGFITAKKAGSAVITAKIGKKSYRCRVRVSNKVRFCNSYGRDINGSAIYYTHFSSSKSSKGIYRYDIKTGKKTKITSLYTAGEIIAYGSYVYFVSYENGASYIYRVSNTGGLPKKLAEGVTPVISGGSLYYFTYPKNQPYLKDALYKMNLDGKNKKKIYSVKDGDYVYLDCRGLYKGKYVLNIDGIPYAVEASGKMSRVSISKYYVHGNSTRRNFDNLVVSDNTYGYVYESSGNKLIRKTGSSRKVLYTFPSTIESITDYGSYLMIQTGGTPIMSPSGERNTTYNLYAISVSGKTVRKVLANEVYAD